MSDNSNNSIKQFEAKLSRMQEKLSAEKAGGIIQQSILYCTDYGQVVGTLTVSKSLLLFEPSLAYFQADNDLSKKFYLFQKFQVSIAMQHVNEVIPVIRRSRSVGPVNEHSYSKFQNQNDFMINVLLNNVGDKKINKKYKSELKSMREQKISLCQVTFKLPDIDIFKDDKVYSSNEKEEIII